MRFVIMCDADNDHCRDDLKVDRDSNPMDEPQVKEYRYSNTRDILVWQACVRTLCCVGCVGHSAECSVFVLGRVLMIVYPPPIISPHRYAHSQPVEIVSYEVMVKC